MNFPAIQAPEGDRAYKTQPIQSSRQRILRTSTTVCLLIMLLSILGCTTLVTERYDANSEVPVESLSPLFAFLATAHAGEAGLVEDPSTGATVRIIAERSYSAASGRTCRRFYVLSTEGYEGMHSGLACEEPSGRWTKSKLLLNPDDLNAPDLDEYPRTH